MGQLVDGMWHRDALPHKGKGGRFHRQVAAFRDFVRADGSTPYKPEAGRYHLYVSLACPWAHRTLIVRKLKGLEEAITVSMVDPFMGEQGWHFGDTAGRASDPLHQSRFLYELYVRARPDFSGRVTVPLLWDRREDTAVNNESSEIVRMFNSEFDAIADGSLDLYPAPLRDEIDALNEEIYANINNGVYRCGFATTQAAYEEAFDTLFGTLDALDERLSRKRYLAGDRITEADWRLFPTLVRFDPVYFGHFKCNRQRIADYPHLSGYLRELYQQPGIAGTVDFRHIKEHYYRSHESINPTRIVPVGPVPLVDLETPHGREHIQ